MPNYRIPGTICSTQQLWSIEDGTLARALMPPASSVCAGSPLFPTKALLDASPSNRVPDLSFLFRQCLSPTIGLSDTDFATAAASLGVEVAVIKAVAEVESSGAGFDESGRPRIPFERHYFHRLTGGKYDARHADISNKSSGGYGKFSAQYAKLEQAYALDRDAALRSASWGRFQIMGNNFRDAGYTSAADFVLAMTKSESAHLGAFVSFVGNSRKMRNALVKKDWAAFAATYNGPAYEKNRYDAKLKEAYDRFVAAQAAGAGRKP